MLNACLHPQDHCPVSISQPAAGSLREARERPRRGLPGVLLFLKVFFLFCKFLLLLTPVLRDQGPRCLRVRRLRSGCIVVLGKTDHPLGVNEVEVLMGGYPATAAGWRLA